MVTPWLPRDIDIVKLDPIHAKPYVQFSAAYELPPTNLRDESLVQYGAFRAGTLVGAARLALGEAIDLETWQVGPQDYRGKGIGRATLKAAMTDPRIVRLSFNMPVRVKGPVSAQAEKTLLKMQLVRPKDSTDYQGSKAGILSRLNAHSLLTARYLR